MSKNKEKQQKLLWEYAKGRSKLHICKEIGMCPKTASKILKREGVIIRPTSSYCRKDWFNEDFFEIINSNEKSYFLGLLYADGNVCDKYNRVQISLSNIDSYILERFKKELSSVSKTYDDRGICSKIILHSKKMVNDLISLGCVPRKSKILRFPKISKLYYSSFIRGFFDGDGSISKRKNGKFTVNFTSNELFLDDLREILKVENVNLSKFYPRYNKIDSCGSAYCIGEQGNNDICKYMYNNCGDLFLLRKYKKYNEIS